MPQVWNKTDHLCVKHLNESPKKEEKKDLP